MLETTTHNLTQKSKKIQRVKKHRLRLFPQGGEAPLPAEPEYPQPTDLLFPGNHIRMFNNLLDRTNLKFDRDGKPRTAYCRTER